MLLYIYVALFTYLTISYPCLTASDRLVRKIAPILEIGLDEISILRNRFLLYLNLSVPRVSRKEVFQPHLPVRLPCYDLAPVTSFTLGRSLRLRTSGTPGSHGLTGGVYKARERIHRAMADARLLANPASRSRVADFDPN